MNTHQIQALKRQMNDMDATPAAARAAIGEPARRPGAVHDFETHQRYHDAARRARAAAVARLLRAAGTGAGRALRDAADRIARRGHPARPAHDAA